MHNALFKTDRHHLIIPLIPQKIQEVTIFHQVQTISTGR